MKLIFICGSLEPGKDGVGDYCGKLASELVRKGHIIGIISLNDKYISKHINGNHEINGVNIPVLRLPGNYTQPCRFKLSENWIKSFDPQLLSLQFVPFSFNKRGLIFGLATNLLRSGNGRPWHIMFHELWVGMELGASIKMQCWGWCQKLMIKRLLNTLKPLSIHTHTSLYKHQLKKLGASVNLLPLFGNLPIQSGITANGKSSGTLKFIIFGGIHYGAPLNNFIDKISIWSKASNYNIEFIFAGSNGPDRQIWVDALKNKNFVVSLLGFLKAEEVVSAFLEADIGITTTPNILVEKSGAVAAMKEFGLPVVCVARDWHVEGFSEKSLLVDSLEDCIKVALQGQRSIRLDVLSTCATQFINEVNI